MLATVSRTERMCCPGWTSWYLSENGPARANTRRGTRAERFLHESSVDEPSGSGHCPLRYGGTPPTPEDPAHDDARRLLTRMPGLQGVLHPLRHGGAVPTVRKDRGGAVRLHPAGRGLDANQQERAAEATRRARGGSAVSAITFCTCCSESSTRTKRKRARPGSNSSSTSGSRQMQWGDSGVLGHPPAASRASADELGDVVRRRPHTRNGRRRSARRVIEPLQLPASLTTVTVPRPPSTRSYWPVFSRCVDARQARDRGQAELARHDRPVRQHAARLHHQPLRPHEQRHPRRVGRRAHQHVPALARRRGGRFRQHQRRPLARRPPTAPRLRACRRPRGSGSGRPIASRSSLNSTGGTSSDSSVCRRLRAAAIFAERSLPGDQVGQFGRREEEDAAVEPEPPVEFDQRAADDRVAHQEVVLAGLAQARGTCGAAAPSP